MGGRQLDRRLASIDDLPGIDQYRADDGVVGRTELCVGQLVAGGLQSRSGDLELGVGGAPVGLGFLDPRPRDELLREEGALPIELRLR
ncbi:hypothetical protein D3C84_946140 [compost metagenome]